MKDPGSHNNMHLHPTTNSHAFISSIFKPLVLFVNTSLWCHKGHWSVTSSELVAIGKSCKNRHFFVELWSEGPRVRSNVSPLCPLSFKVDCVIASIFLQQTPWCTGVFVRESQHALFTSLDHRLIDLSAGSRMLLCTAVPKCHSVVRWIRVALSSVPVSTRFVYTLGWLYWTVIRVQARWHKKQQSLMVCHQRSIDSCGRHVPGLWRWCVCGLVASVSPALQISTSTWARADGCFTDSVARRQKYLSVCL